MEFKAKIDFCLLRKKKRDTCCWINYSNYTFNITEIWAVKICLHKYEREGIKFVIKAGFFFIRTLVKPSSGITITAYIWDWPKWLVNLFFFLTIVYNSQEDKYPVGKKYSQNIQFSFQVCLYCLLKQMIWLKGQSQCLCNKLCSNQYNDTEHRNRLWTPQELSLNLRSSQAAMLTVTVCFYAYLLLTALWRLDRYSVDEVWASSYPPCKRYDSTNTLTHAHKPLSLKLYIQ